MSVSRLSEVRRMRVVSQVGWLAILVAFVSLFARLLSFFSCVFVIHPRFYDTICCAALFTSLSFLFCFLLAFFIYFYVRGIIRILISQTLGLFML